MKIRKKKPAPGDLLDTSGIHYTPVATGKGREMVRLWLRRKVWGTTDGTRESSHPYAVTHLPTGMRFRGYHTKKEANFVTRRLAMKKSGLSKWGESLPHASVKRPEGVPADRLNAAAEKAEREFAAKYPKARKTRPAAE